MAHVVDASQVDAPESVAPAAAPTKAASILDGIRASAAEARRNLWCDTPLPDAVPGTLGLRLGIPTDVRESALDESSSVENCLADIASNILGVVDIANLTNTTEDVIDGLDVITVAEAFAAELYGASRPVANEEDAVRELFSRGTPPQVNAQAVRSTATMYRRWSLDPTPPRSSTSSSSE